jgi:hypothetical protein
MSGKSQSALRRTELDDVKATIFAKDECRLHGVLGVLVCAVGLEREWNFLRQSENVATSWETLGTTTWMDIVSSDRKSIFELDSW